MEDVEALQDVLAGSGFPAAAIVKGLVARESFGSLRRDCDR